MFKKVWVAALAVVVGLVTLGVVSPKLAGVVRLRWRNMVKNAERQVSPETKVELINQKLDALDRDDRRYADQIARDNIRVQNLQEEVNAQRARLATLDADGRAMFESSSAKASW